ncbi:cytochrome c3 family protein [Desulfonatronum thioautotrophicum]|uniref:cytochrome c3 family protein n=1 Tax=Desulfonatronum thioautotrophicum TaxID=617001 RepID=UPI0005EB663E|nr:cytochrome c3 family protein [Desulfonatronum thioautotrophicum]
MKKSMFLLMAIAALVIAFVLPSLHAADVPGDDYMIPKPGGDYEPRVLSIPFSHNVHAEIDCYHCHHTGDVNEGCMDAGCHDLIFPETPEERRDIRYFEKAYHDQCIGCHRDLRQQELPTGPVACVGCHPRD